MSRFPAVAFMAVLLFALSSCEYRENLSGTPNPNFSGEELYRGVVWGYGPVAEFIPEVRDFRALEDHVEDPAALHALVSLQDRTVDRIREIRPGYFSAVKAALESGDPVEIDMVIRDMVSTTQQAIGSLPEIVEMRRRIRENPRLLVDMRRQLRAEYERAGLSASQIERGMKAALAGHFEGEPVPVPSVSEQGTVVWIVALFAAAVTVVGGTNYALAVNLALAVNYQFAFAVTSTVTLPGGPEDPHEEPIADCAYYVMTCPASNRIPEATLETMEEHGSLVYERTVSSIARTLMRE